MRGWLYPCAFASYVRRRIAITYNHARLLQAPDGRAARLENSGHTEGSLGSLGTLFLLRLTYWLHQNLGQALADLIGFHPL